MKDVKEVVDAFEELWKEEPKNESKKKPSKAHAERAEFLAVCYYFREAEYLLILVTAYSEGD